MGSNLRRQLREALPETVKGLPRAVALEIADDARWDDAWRYDPEKGRRSKARLADLVRWTASKNERVIRDALRNLSLAGWEFRLPMGKDRKGNLLYAVPGHALEFRVPDFEAPTVVGPGAEETSEGTVTAGPIGTVTTGPSSEGPVTTAEGPVVTAEGPVITVAATVTTGPPSLVSSFSPKDSPSSSVAEDVLEGSVRDADGTEGGGGGVSESRSIAEMVVDALDYRGQAPNRKQKQTLTDRLAAALEGGWTLEALADYLRLKGAVDSAYAVYAYRLKPDVIPDPPQPTVAQQATTQLVPPVCDACRSEYPAAAVNVRLRFRVIDGENQACPDCHPSLVTVTSGSFADLADGLYAPSPFAGDPADGGLWERAAARAEARSRPLTGTDATVQGWLDISRQLAEEESTADQRVAQGQRLASMFRAQEQKAIGVGRSYSNDVWSQPADPAQAAKIPHCGAPDCDPGTRLKTAPDWSGELHTSVCGACHPAMRTL